MSGASQFFVNGLAMTFESRIPPEPRQVGSLPRSSRARKGGRGRGWM